MLTLEGRERRTIIIKAEIFRRLKVYAATAGKPHSKIIEDLVRKFLEVNAVGGLAKAL